MQELVFTAFGTPRPQGSAKAFVRGNQAFITSDNPKLKPYRHTLTQVALEELRKNTPEGPLCARGIPVEVSIIWTLAKPKSKPKRVIYPTSKPDTDKLCRAVLDSLTGVGYEDDAQVVQIIARKRYGSPEQTEVRVRPYSPLIMEEL
jgi:Holliday junction resolvase RusA-like endonuclease